LNRLDLKFVLVFAIAATVLFLMKDPILYIIGAVEVEWAFPWMNFLVNLGLTGSIGMWIKSTWRSILSQQHCLQLGEYGIFDEMLEDT